MRFVMIVLSTFVLATRAAAQDHVGAFLVQEERDPLTRQVAVTAATPSHEDGDMVLLVWRCAPEMGVVLTFRRMQVIGGDPSDPHPTLPIHWWFDGDPRARTSWLLASAGQQLILPRHETSAFTQRAKTATRLFVRFDGSPGDRATYTFELAGSAEALGKLPCHA